MEEVGGRDDRRNRLLSITHLHDTLSNSRGILIIRDFFCFIDLFVRLFVVRFLFRCTDCETKLLGDASRKLWLSVKHGNSYNPVER